MKLCTIVTESAWLKLLESESLVCDDPAHLRDPDNLLAHEWMGEQMTQRLGPPPPGAKLPLFAWYRLDNGKTKPNAKTWYWEEKEVKLYRLELVVPDNQALLSDGSFWGCVKHDSFVAFTEEEWTAYYEKYGTKPITPELGPEAERLKRLSWEKLFDLETDRSWGNPEWKNFSVQACLWKIELSQVTKVQPYVSTGYKWKTIKPRFRCLHDKIKPPFDQYSEGNITIQCSSDQQP